MDTEVEVEEEAEEEVAAIEMAAEREWTEMMEEVEVREDTVAPASTRTEEEEVRKTDLLHI